MVHDTTFIKHGKAWVDCLKAAEAEPRPGLGAYHGHGRSEHLPPPTVGIRVLKPFPEPRPTTTAVKARLQTTPNTANMPINLRADATLRREASRGTAALSRITRTDPARDAPAMTDATIAPAMTAPKSTFRRFDKASKRASGRISSMNAA